MLRVSQRAWTLAAGAALAITVEDFISGAWVAGLFGIVITILLLVSSFPSKIVMAMPYPMPSPDVVSELVGNRPIGFCQVGPVPHAPHVWTPPLDQLAAGEPDEYACLGHYCQHPERHV